MNKSFPASLCEPDGTFIGYFSIAVGQTAIRTEQLQGWHHLLIVYFQGHRAKPLTGPTAPGVRHEGGLPGPPPRSPCPPVCVEPLSVFCVC